MRSLGTAARVRYHDGVRANRTGCLAKHPHDDHGTVGAFRHIETMELREEDVDDLFFSEDESDEVVEARFVNDGDDDVDIYWRVLKLETRSRRAKKRPSRRRPARAGRSDEETTS